MDLRLDTLPPAVNTRPKKESFLSESEWQQVRNALASERTFRQIFTHLRERLQQENRRFFLSCDVFKRCYYMWKRNAR